MRLTLTELCDVLVGTVSCFKIILKALFSMFDLHVEFLTTVYIAAIS